MPRPNPFTSQLDNMVKEMRRVAAGIDKVSEGVEPFDSEDLSPQEEAFVFQNPIALFPDEKDEQTGVPLNNAQAAALLLEQMGPEKYTEWVMKHYRRMLKRGGDL